MTDRRLATRTLHELTASRGPFEHEPITRRQRRPLVASAVERFGHRRSHARAPLGDVHIGEVLGGLQVAAMPSDHGSTRLRATTAHASKYRSPRHQTPEAMVVSRRRLDDVLRQIVRKVPAVAHQRARHDASLAEVRFPSRDPLERIVNEERDAHEPSVRTYGASALPTLTARPRGCESVGARGVVVTMGRWP